MEAERVDLFVARGEAHMRITVNCSLYVGIVWVYCASTFCRSENVKEERNVEDTKSVKAESDQQNNLAAGTGHES